MADDAHFLYRSIATRASCNGTMLRVQSPIQPERAFYADPQGDPDAATLDLASYLYAHYYACAPRLAEARNPLVVLGVRLADPQYWERLRTANPGRGYFDPGWRVTSWSSQDELYVEKGGITLLIDPRAHLREPGARPAVSSFVSIRFPKDAAMAAPGFYLAYGDAGSDRSPHQTRLYLNLRASCAPVVVEAILSALNAAGVPCTLKVIADRSEFDRRDNTVLYIGRADFAAVARVLAQCRAAGADAFREDVPAFVKPLWHGIGVADSPPCIDGLPEQSFGQHRTRMIAEAIMTLVAAPSDTSSTPPALTSEAVYQAIVSRLVSEGMDPDRPHLNARDADDYELVDVAG